MSGGGVFRTLKFVKYLPEYGWFPTVIASGTKNYWIYDYSLLNEIPRGVKTLYTFEPDMIYLEAIFTKLGMGNLYQKLKSKYIIPDEKITWLPTAYHAAKKELKSGKYKIIYSTSPSPVAHIIAYMLKKRFGLPWVADYRDLWTLNPDYNSNIKGRAETEQKLEGKIIKEADIIIHVSKGNKNIFSRKFHVPENRLEVIYNGFDEINCYDETRSSPSICFTITYTGTFYGRRNPRNFLISLKKLIMEENIQPGRLKFAFYGKSDFQIQSFSKSLGIQEYISINSPIPRKQLTDVYKHSTILLLIIPTDSPGVITSKVFDYMGLRKPIFAIIPDGEAKEILIQSGLGFFADPDSTENITKQLKKLFKSWENGKLKVTPHDNFIQQFHRKNLTQKLANIFNSLT